MARIRFDFGTLTLDGAVVNDIRLLYLEQVYKDGSAHP